MNNEPMNQTDQILEELRPRMRAARVSHVRRMVGVLAIVPLLGIGAMAMAAESDSSTEIETAGEAPGTTGDSVDLPDIGDASHDEGEHDAGEHEGAEPKVVETDDDVPTTTKAPEPTTEAPEGGEVLEVGVLGALEVEPTEDSFKVLSHTLTDGWEIIESETTDDGALLIYVTNGDVVKVITVKSGIRDEILVHVEVWTPPTTTTTTVKPKPEPEPIVDRFSVEVPGHGSFIVEREGETLWVGNVTPAEGHEYEVHKWEGWKVWVGFYAEGHVWYGKAQVNDNGEVQLIFWDEELAPEPVHQWVEISGVGAAKFAILDGQIQVVKTETAEGFGSWDYNQGAWAETAKVDFEGEGQIWFIDAWLTEGGELVWNSYQGGE